MVEARPAVALLFDDAELGGHLRQVLQEHGANIVHEGTVASFDAALQRRLDPDVLVVNLDDEDDAAFDRLVEMIDGERPRLVFNDARASRALGGWDRARWARHLAVKVLASGDVDPPRPADALALEAAPAVADPLAGEPAVAPLVEPVAALSPEPASHEPVEPDSHGEAAPVESDALDGEHVAQSRATSDDLEAELAALLAADDPLPEEDAVPAAPRQELPLHDGDFSLAMPADVQPAAPVEAAPPVLPKAPAAPDSWSLVDDDALVSVDAVHAEADDFGIEKLSAADFLAPDVEPAAPEFQPTMSLELMSMEEAVAPQAWEPNEMLLDDLGSVPSRVVLLGAAVDGLDAVCDFLASLPASSRLTILLTQHFGGQPADAVLQRLSAHASLPVRLAAHGSRARSGEVLLVPAEGLVQMRRDGSVEVRNADGVQEPSIDASFTMAANVFGRDALGIVFAGRSTDAVAGAQAIHDRGGQVWVETSDGEHFADMVSGIFAERLVSYSGTLHELAAHLIEVYP
ncbi:chemotaxis protein CheB [Rhodanobacter geophilus]|uniref:protein-glutamate methylesterase n=1 Tax=Rhodanobacter geophilus TaxID=3162488 RepID=A0ABV3QN70_9GAMM